MNQAVDYIRQPRLKILEMLNQYSIEQLNTIPAGFNNNILWNLAHMVAAQQGVCYNRAGLPKMIDDAFFNAYKPDTKPEKFIDAAEYERIKELMLTTLDQLEEDLDKKLFANYTQWTARYGMEIKHIDDALAFLPFHEGLHVGYIMSLRKLV